LKLFKGSQSAVTLKGNVRNVELMLSRNIEAYDYQIRRFRQGKIPFENLTHTQARQNAEEKKQMDADRHVTVHEISK